MTLDIYTTVTKELKQREFGNFEEKLNQQIEANNIFNRLITKYPDDYYGLRAEFLLNKKIFPLFFTLGFFCDILIVYEILEDRLI